jgi:putative sigma-54 modulation protein
MKIVTNARNIELTAPIKAHVEEKLGRLSTHFDFILEVHVILEIEKNPRIAANQLAEATIHVSGAVLRVEAGSDNLYTSIDMLADKIERSMRKHKTKLLARGGRGHHESIRKEGLQERDSQEPDLEKPEGLDVDIELEEGVEISFVNA